MTTFRQFQDSASRVPVSLRNSRQRIEYLETGFHEEAGKISRLLSRASNSGSFQLTPEQVAELKQRLGELLHFIAVACSEAKVSMQDVAAGSLTQLEERLEGLDPEQR